MDKKTKFQIIMIAVTLVIAAVISIVSMITEKRVDGLQIGNVLALALIGVVAAVVIFINKKGGNHE